jgi:glycosyltransferase involved in cell wall biosynthesis
MKIAHVIFSFTMGGAETMLVDIMNEQAKYANIHLIVVNDNVDDALLGKIGKDIKVHLVLRKEGSRNPVPILVLNGILFRNQFETIHCHNEELVRAIFFTRKRTALTIHGLGQSVKGLGLYGKMFSISKSVQRDVHKRCGLRSTVIYNGIFCDRVKQRVRARVSPDQCFRLVQVGRLQHEQKGQHILLQALDILGRLYGITKVTVDFIGEGTSLDQLSQMAKRMNLSERVRFLGLMDRASVYLQLCEYHALVQPSISEGFGLTVVEGMAARIPVIVSDMDGPMEIIDGGRFGLHFKVGDASDCARVIKILLNDYNTEQVDKLVQGAWKKANEDFDMKVTARRYYSEYMLTNRRKIAT